MYTRSDQFRMNCTHRVACQRKAESCQELMKTNKLECCNVKCCDSNFCNKPKYSGWLNKRTDRDIHMYTFNRRFVLIFLKPNHPCFRFIITHLQFINIRKLSFSDFFQFKSYLYILQMTKYLLKSVAQKAGFIPCFVVLFSLVLILCLFSSICFGVYSGKFIFFRYTIFSVVKKLSGCKACKRGLCMPARTTLVSRLHAFIRVKQQAVFVFSVSS